MHKPPLDIESVENNELQYFKNLLQLACCCGSAAVSCCCSCCPSCRSSVTTRIMYTFFLLLGVIVSAILLSDNVQESLKDKVCVYYIERLE